jgi:hypothetical protein
MTARRGANAPSWLDRSADGRILRWEPHVLSHEMASSGSDWLEAEPSLLEPAEVASQLIEARPIEGGIELVTDGWARLRATPSPPVASDTAAGGSRDLKPPPRKLRWSDPPFADCFDLTPFDALGRPGATIRVRRPPLQPYLPFRFRYHHGALHDRISCQADKAQAIAWFEPLFLVTLKLVAPDRFKLSSAERELKGGAGDCTSPHDFRGLVAVVGSRDSRRYLLDCRSVFQQLLSSNAPAELAEWQAASELLRCEWPADEVWPQRSHDRLKALRAAAESAGLPPDQAERRPRGVLRWLVLRACGATPQASESAVLELDAAGDLASLLTKWRPRAFPLAAEIDDPGARLWTLQGESLPDLAEIAALAGGGGEASLRLATELLPVKKKWEDLLSKVRPGGCLAALATQRIGQIELTVRSREPLPSPEEGLAKAAAGLAEEAARPLRAGGSPPEGKQRYQDWLTLTELARGWRGLVAAVLDFCESGTWTTDSSPAEADAGDLLRRARQLAEPLALGETGDPTDIARLQAAVEQILHDAEHEPAAGERQSILDELNARIRPCPERWAAYHAALRRAGALARTWPALAAYLGLAADGSGERTRVVLLLQLAVDLRRELDSLVWSDMLGTATSGALGELLTTPGDPRIAAAYAEAEILGRRLAGTPGLPALRPAPPLRPAAVRRQEFFSWWRELRGLDAVLVQLRDLSRDQERWTRQARDLVRARCAAGGAPAAAGCSHLAVLLAADPAGLSRAQYEQLLAATISPGDTTDGQR